MQPSFSYYSDGSLACASGFEAVDCVRVAHLIMGIKMLHKTGGRLIPTRGFTMKRGLTMASQYTGRAYKRTEVEKALADLKVWLETMKSTIPVQERV